MFSRVRYSLPVLLRTSTHRCAGRIISYTPYDVSHRFDLKELRIANLTTHLPLGSTLLNSVILHNTLSMISTRSFKGFARYCLKEIFTVFNGFYLCPQLTQVGLTNTICWFSNPFRDILIHCINKQQIWFTCFFTEL